MFYLGERVLSEVVSCHQGGSILVGIELVGAGYGYAERGEYVEDADGVSVGCEHLGEALVAVGPPLRRIQNSKH
jgi:hypothetical protein